jgi:hypothetical protein
MTVVVAAMAASGEHRARNHQQESYDKNLLHGKHPSTLRFPADRCGYTNVPKEKRCEVAAGTGWAFTCLRALSKKPAWAVTETDAGRAKRVTQTKQENLRGAETLALFIWEVRADSTVAELLRPLL